MYERVASKFTDIRDSEKLSGGQGNSFRFGRVTIKPIDEVEKYSWVADVLEAVEITNLLISKPVRSKIGNWVEDGFGATEFHRGLFENGRIAEKTVAAKKFHLATRSVPIPADFKKWVSPWSQAAGVAWEENDVPSRTLSTTRRALETIMQEYTSIDLRNQFIHSDLAGNILFNGSIPLIIDVSPDYRPEEYAEVMLVTDSIAWHSEPVSSLDILNFTTDLKKQLILRAVVFRLCVPVFFDPLNQCAFEATMNDFRPVLNYIGIGIGKVATKT